MNPFETAPKGKKLQTVIAVYIAMITSIFISSSTSILLPAAAKEIGGLDIYPLATSIAGCLGIALMPMYGFIAARNPSIKRTLGAVSFLIAGFVIFSRAFAQSMWFIVIPSVFLSIYSPAIYVLGYSTIRDMYDKEKAGTFLGLAGTMQSIGILAGGPLIGFIVDQAGWRTPHYLLGTLFLVGAVLMYFGVKVTKEEVKHMASTTASFDFTGAIAIVVFLAGVILALSLGEFAPFGSFLNNILWVMAAVALIILIADIVKKKDKAIIPSTVLSDRNTLCLTGFNFFANFSIMALFFFLPLYATYVLQQTSAAAGLTLTCMSIAGLFMGPIFGKMIGKAGNARNIALITTVIRIVIFIAFIIFLKPTTPIWLIYILMLLLGFSSSAAGVVPAVGPQVQIAQEKRQLGNSVVQLGSGFGSSLGISIYTMVIAPFGVEGGMPIALYIATGGAIALFLTSMLLKKLPAAEPAK